MTSTKSLVDLIAQAGPMVSVREHPIKPVACKGRHIKRVGSGVRRVIDTVVAYGLPEPEFEATQGGMAVTVFKNTDKAFTPAQPESQPESKPESDSRMEAKVLKLLVSQPMGKSQLSSALGQKAVSGQLNKVIRALLAAGHIEPTIPGKPTSRLQQYRLSQQPQHTATS